MTTDGVAESQRYVGVSWLLPQRRNGYLRLHASVWPSVVTATRASNIRNHSIFVADDLLVSYYEYVGTDLDADLELLQSNPVMQRRWSLTDPCQRPLGVARSETAGSRWLALREILHQP